MNISNLLKRLINEILRVTQNVVVKWTNAQFSDFMLESKWEEKKMGRWADKLKFTTYVMKWKDTEWWKFNVRRDEEKLEERDKKMRRKKEGETGRKWTSPFNCWFKLEEKGKFQCWKSWWKRNTNDLIFRFEEWKENLKFLILKAPTTSLFVTWYHQFSRIKKIE